MKEIKVLKRNKYTSYITIPKFILEQIELKNGDDLIISNTDNLIIIQKKEKEQNKCS